VATLQQTHDTLHRIDLHADDRASQRLRRVLDSLEYDFDRDVADVLKLATTELVTNAVRHSGARQRGDHVVVFIRIGPPSLLVKVCDRGPGVEQGITRPDLMSEGGRGLFLIEALAEKWGSSTVEVDGHKWSCVWACFGEEALPTCAQTA
jgi:anti-sigma regulatory factor (Ser/Thr protein kinase)